MTDGEQFKGKEVMDESSERKTTNVGSFHFCPKSKNTNPFGSAGCTIARIIKMLFMKSPCNIRSTTNSVELTERDKKVCLLTM